MGSRLASVAFFCTGLSRGWQTELGLPTSAPTPRTNGCRLAADAPSRMSPIPFHLLTVLLAVDRGIPQATPGQEVGTD
jgi:hypothetical protein